MAAKTQGSWFPSGYHGHFRSQSRNDFVNEYRHQAKPCPPHKFSKLLQERPTVHHFSKHDNKYSFINTVDSFQDGLGKKKIKGTFNSKFVPDFISWVPHKKEIQESGPAFSSYRDSYRDSYRSQQDDIPQILLQPASIPNVSNNHAKSLGSSASSPKPIESKPLTTYNFVYQHLQPNPNVNTNMNTGKVNDDYLPLEKSFTYINPRHKSIYDRPKEGFTNLRRSRIKSAPFMRTTVADCLNWYHAPANETIESLEYSKRPKTALTDSNIELEYSKRPYKTAFSDSNIEIVNQNQDCSVNSRPSPSGAGNYRPQRPVQTSATALATSEVNQHFIYTNDSLNLPSHTLNTVGNEPE